MTELLQSPWRFGVGMLRGRQTMVTLAPGRFSIALLQGRKSRKVLARFEETLAPSAGQGVKAQITSGFDVELLRRTLGRIPADWRSVPCHVVVSSSWVQWGDIPWLGTRVSIPERMALGQKRLAALYGEADRIMATEGAHFGCAQMVAGLHRIAFNDIGRVFTDTHLRLASLEAAHSAVWNTLAPRARQQVKQEHEYPLTGRDRLFATVEGDRLTVSWHRYSLGDSKAVPLTQPKAIRGIRHVRLDTQTGGVDSATETERAGGSLPKQRNSLVRQLQRECVLQRLVSPAVTVVLRKPLRGADAPSADPGLPVKEAPLDWCIVEVDEWFEASAGNVRYRGGDGLWNISLDFVKADRGLRSPAWHRWLLGGAVACACAVGAVYVQWNAQLEQTQEALEQNTHAQEASANTSSQHTPMLNAEQRERRAKWVQVQSSLLRPWEALFQCIESSINSDVTLMQIQPDAQTQDLHLTGDAREFKAIGKFVRALQEHAVPPDDAPKTVAPSASAGKSHTGATSSTPICANIGSPYLSSFQVNEQDPQHAVHFEINARWLLTRSAVATEAYPVAGKSDFNGEAKP